MKRLQSSNKHPTIEEAMKMVDLRNHLVPPVGRNGLVCENETMFYKIRALINCPKYEAFQTEFYDLDPDNISPELEEKINKMYRKAVASGDITGTEDGEEQISEAEYEADGEDRDGDDETVANGRVDDYVNPYRDENYREPYQYTGQVVGDLNLGEIPASGPVVSTFTCLYTALDRDGGYKTGKFYSNASTADTARIDAVSKLAAFGYKNIEIAAVETGTVSPAQVAGGDVGDDIEQVPPEDQIQSEEPPESGGEQLPTTTPVELGDDEKLQMFSDWFQAFKSTLWDMDTESLAQLNDEQKKEFWTRLKTKTVELPQDPRTFINKTTMDKLEQGTFPNGVKAEEPVEGETADADEDVQAALNGNPGEEPPPEGNEGPGETGNAQVFNGGADNGGMEEVSPEGGGEEAPAQPAAQQAAPQNAQEQPQNTPENPEGNEEEGEEVVTEDEEDGDEIDWFNLPDNWNEQPDEYGDEFDIGNWLAANPVEPPDNNEEVVDDEDEEFSDLPEYEPTVEPPEEEPVEGFEQFGEMPRRCFYDVVREKNPYNGDGPFDGE